jgi:hypothetical protein
MSAFDDLDSHEWRNVRALVFWGGLVLLAKIPKSAGG